MRALLTPALLFVAFSSSPTHAIFGDGWLTEHVCDDENSARKCDSRCTRIPDTQVRHKVDQKNNTVLQQRRLGGQLEPPKSLGVCSILDKSNWSCSEERKAPKFETYYLIKHQMAGGVYFHSIEGSIGGRDNRSYWCAK